MKKHRGGPAFTHFASLPFIRPAYRDQLSQIQSTIREGFAKINADKHLEPNNPNLFHLTLSMLTLPHQKTRENMCKLLEENKEQLLQPIKNTVFTTGKIRYFTRKDMKNPQSQPFINVIYLELDNDEQFRRIEKLTDIFIRLLLKDEIIVSEELKAMNIAYDHNTNLFKINQPHITLFRCREIKESEEIMDVIKTCEEMFKGKKLECQFLDISTRFQYDQTQFYRPLWRMSCLESL